MKTGAIIVSLLAGLAAASCAKPPVKVTEKSVADADATVAAPLPPARPHRGVIATAHTWEEMEAARAATRDNSWHDNDGVMRFGEADSGVVYFTMYCQGDGMKLDYQLMGDGPYPDSLPIRITAPGAGTPQPVIAKTYRNEVMDGYNADATIPSDGAIAKAVYAGSAITTTEKGKPVTWIALPPTRAKALADACAAQRAEIGSP